MLPVMARKCAQLTGQPLADTPNYHLLAQREQAVVLLLS